MNEYTQQEQDTDQPITQEDKALLLESIEAAEGPGGCKYTVHGDGAAPCCVVGQFAHRKGVSLRTLAWFDVKTELVQDIYDALPEVHSVPQLLLSDLQNVWDSAGRAKISNAREKMREIVNGWPVVGGEEG